VERGETEEAKARVVNEEPVRVAERRSAAILLDERGFYDHAPGTVQHIRCAHQNLDFVTLHVDFQKIHDQTLWELVIQSGDAHADCCCGCGAGYRTREFGTGFVKRVQVSRRKHVQGSGASTLAESALDDGDAWQGGEATSEGSRLSRRRLETKGLLRMQYRKHAIGPLPKVCSNIHDDGHARKALSRDILQV
jgi:hypothetical protein